MKRKKVLSLYFWAWLFVPLVVADAETIRKTIVVDGTQRDYTLYLPESYDGSENWPLVINMHGAEWTANQQMWLSGMNAVADEHDFLVVYPQALGSPPMWNNLKRPGRADEAGFVGAMMDELENDFSINSSRVYATGVSQGGSMSYLIGTELSHRIAAIAAVSGRNAHNPTAARPLPLLLMHGTADSVSPIEGGVNALGVRIPSIAEVMNAWVDSNRCVGTPVTTDLPDLNQDDDSTIVTHHHDQCATYKTSAMETRHSDVLFYEIENGDHTWPGGPAFGNAVVNRDIDASTEIWKFFSQHELPSLLPGDFDGSGVLDANDISLLAIESESELTRRVFDVDGNGVVDLHDHRFWVANLANTYFGDANLDLEFNSSDMVQVFAAGQYETGEEAGWSSGDWDGNGLFNSSDMVTAFADGGYEKGPRPDAVAVPEPGGWLLLILGVAGLVTARRR